MNCSELEDRLVVYHDKYYLVYPTQFSDSLWFGNQLYTFNTPNINTIFACFDSNGHCLWSKPLNSVLSIVDQELRRIDVDTTTGLIYLTGNGASHCGQNIGTNYDLTIYDGDTLWDDAENKNSILACYDTLGNKQWMKYYNGLGNMDCSNVKVLPNNKLAFGGGAYFNDANLGGFHTNLGQLEYAAFFSIYDCGRDAFVMLQTMPSLDRSTALQFATDNNGNLLFVGPMSKHDYVVCGSDTLYSIGDGIGTIFFGRYGWGCDTVAQWPGPPEYTLSLNVNQQDMGTVWGAGTYTGGSSIPIRAVAYTGHSFDHWSDGSTQSSREIYLIPDPSLTAHFVKSQTDPEGIVQPGTPRLVLHPNPTTGLVQILGLDGQSPDVEILDMTGRP